MESESVKPLSTGEAADYLTARGYQISKATVIRLIKRGEISAMRTPSGYARIKRSVLDRFIEARR